MDCNSSYWKIQRDQKMIRRKVHITMIRWFVSSNTILKLFGLSRFVITKARQSISARSCWFVCVSRSELFAVWSKPGVVYFYYTLWHTNWPNVFLWRINYWLSDRRTWKICFDRLMFGGWCRLEKSSGLFFFHSTKFDTLNPASGFFSFFFHLLVLVQQTKNFYYRIDKHQMRYARCSNMEIDF